MRHAAKRAAGRPEDPADPKRRRTAPAAGPGARRAAHAPREGPRPAETERPEADGATEPETPHESALDALRARRARSRQVRPDSPPRALRTPCARARSRPPRAVLR